MRFISKKPPSFWDLPVYVTLQERKKFPISAKMRPTFYKSAAFYQKLCRGGRLCPPLQRAARKYFASYFTYSTGSISAPSFSTEKCRWGPMVASAAAVPT